VGRGGTNEASQMMSRLWYRVRLRPDQVAAGDLEIIRRRFVRAVKRRDGVAGACLFVAAPLAHLDHPCADRADERDSAADSVFFSPASIALIPRVLARYDAEPCEPPDRAHAALLVGMAWHWDLLPYAVH
jgi:hypothetical protein